MEKLKKIIQKEKEKCVEEVKKLPVGLFDSTPYLKEVIKNLNNLKK